MCFWTLLSLHLTAGTCCGVLEFVIPGEYSGEMAAGAVVSLVGGKLGIACAEHPSSLLVLISCPLPAYLSARRD